VLATVTRRQWAQDVVIAAAMLAFCLIGTGPAGANQPDATPVDALAYALAATAALVLFARRWAPLPVLGVSTAATSTYLILGYAYGPILVAYAFAVYAVAACLPLRPAAFAAGISLAVMLLHSVVGDADVGVVGVVPATAWVVVPFALGVTVRMGRESAARNRAERLRDIAHEERLRVAQEVHDVVGHGLAAINMQAEIALHVLPKRPEQAATALAAIGATSKAALEELRATLALVRSDAAEHRQPGPGLAQLDALVGRLADTGVPVRVQVEGVRRTLPAAVDLAAYRVVQESLTNVLRHAGAATATVRVGYASQAVTVEVTDDGRGRAPDDGGDGHGITGMRARVAALGGRFAAGPAESGGFRVYASMPAIPPPDTSEPE
jgi:signal transduction histidine kinase